MTDVGLKDEDGSVLKFTRQMSREIEKTAFLVVDNVQNTYANLFNMRQNNQNHN
jgi:hypothetical protein